MTTTAGCGSGRAAILAVPTFAVIAWLITVLPPSVLEWIPGRFVEELGE